MAKATKPKAKKNQVKVPVRNQSPYGWWVASYVMRAVWDDNPNPSPRSRCRAWENTIVLRAEDREEAYVKAMQLAQDNCSVSFTEEGSDATGHWVLDGLTDLLPIYDLLEDGTEILWSDYQNCSVAKIRSLAKPKEKLTVFDDSLI